jgi:CheY-like chemotaxis protein
MSSPTATLPSAGAASPARRVLVVDDSRAMQAIIRRVLEGPSLGRTEVETTSCGEEALRLLERGPPDLVISDWHMPGMTGIELLQTLRQTGHGELPFGFVTTVTTPALLQQALTNGAAFIVHKPFHDHELLAAVGPLLGRGGDAWAGGLDPVHGGRAMRRIVQACMPGVPFRVIENEKFGSQHLSPQNLFAVYASPADGSICALAAMDLPAVCMLGGSALQVDPASIRQAIKDGSPSAELVGSATAFLREMAPQLGGQVGVADAVFKGANLVARDAVKLKAALDSGNRRADYRLSVPGYGDGRLVFIRS